MPDVGYGCFYVNGRYADPPGAGPARVGQMYVEYRVVDPVEPYPIVFVHGGGSTGTVWISCPDGRPGWAPFFVEHGFAVYMVDWPGCGRSAYSEPAYGPADWRGQVDEMERRFTDLASHRLWPQARLHTQWPGSGHAGDPIFDAMMDSRGNSGPRDVALAQSLTRDALSALLDRIGPAIVVTHSAGGPIGWAIADARPDAVKALIQLEPAGPPVREATSNGEEGGYDESGEIVRPWGLTSVPLTYEPAVGDPSELEFVPGPEPGRADRCTGWLQAEPARRLVNLARVPTLLSCGEAARHAYLEHATSAYLRQAGVEHDFVRLEDAGFRGNGHKMMSELNNLEIAEFLRGWIADTVR